MLKDNLEVTIVRHDNKHALVKEFMAAFNQLPTWVGVAPETLIAFRRHLIKSELDETLKGIEEDNREEILDGLIDIKYVLLGTYVAFKLGYERRMIPMHQAIQHLQLFGMMLPALSDHDGGLWSILDTLDLILESAVDQHGFRGVFDAAFNDVHAANMAKLSDTRSDNPDYTSTATIGGKYIIKNAAGKVMKPTNWSPVSLEKYL